MEPQKHLSAESELIFKEGIGLVLSRWSALQIAVENEWGGRDSRRKADLLASEIFSWFTQSTETLYMDDLENMLDEAMLSLNTMTEDGSIEEVAEKLMVMHDECLDGNFSSVDSLRASGHQRVALPHVKQAVNDDDDDDDDDSDEDDGRDGNVRDSDSSNMVIDGQPSVSNLNPVDIPVNEPMPKPRPPEEAEDGWVVVGPRRNKGKKN